MTYTAEEVRKQLDPSWIYAPTVRKMLNAYADMLERQAAGVTDEVVRTALCHWFEDPSGEGLVRGTPETEGWFVRMRAALEAALSTAQPVAAEPVAQQAARVDEAVRVAGAMLANCAFNLAQSDKLDERQRRSLDESRKAWDAAIAAIPVAAEPVTQPAERHGEVLIEAVGRVERDMTGELGINWLVEGGIDALEEGSVLLCSEHDYLTDDDGSATLYLHPTTPVGVPNVKAMVDRFLRWPLPADFAPDCGISFKHEPDALGYAPSWPIGTNLLTAYQAKAMFEYVLADVAAPVGVPDGEVLVPASLSEDMRKAMESEWKNQNAFRMWDAVLAAAPSAPQEYPECSGNPASCPENEGYGCCAKYANQERK